MTDSVGSRNETAFVNDNVRSNRVKLDINNLFKQIDDLLSNLDDENRDRAGLGIGFGVELLQSYLQLIAIRAIELKDDVLIGLLLDLHVLKEVEENG